MVFFRNDFRGGIEMSKKGILSFLIICFVGFVTNADAYEVVVWSYSSGIDNLWNTAVNWNLNRIPSIANDDFAIIRYNGSHNCLIDASHTDANAAQTNYLRVGHWNHGTGQLQMDGGVLTVGKTLIVGEDTIGRFYMNDGTVTSGEDILIGCSYGTADANGSLVMNRGTITSGGDIFIGFSNEASDANGSLVMNGGTLASIQAIRIGYSCGVAGTKGSLVMNNGLLSTTFGPLVVGQRNGIGILTILGGNINIGKPLYVGQDGGTGSLNMSGGTINIGNELLGNIGNINFVIGRKLGTGTASISGGLINVTTGSLYLGCTNVAMPGVGTLKMTGGKISISNDLMIGLEGSTGHLQLDGGEIWACGLIMDSNGTIDVNAGTLVIDGNCVEEIAGYIQEPNNWITAAGGNGRLVIDYDIRNSDKTTIIALSNDANLPQLTIIVEPNEPNDIGVDSIVPPINEPIYYWQNQLIRIGTGPSRKCPYVYRFDHWEGDVAEPNSPSTTVLMDTDKTIKAVFYRDNNRECGDECHPILQSDLNRDCYVDFEDFMMFTDKWMVCTDPNCDPI
jgi:hypothetical protein